MTTSQIEPKDTRRPVDLFLGSFKRSEKLTAMIESVRATGYPARVLVAAGDLETVRTCERYPDLVECLYSTQVNKRIGCTAPLNLLFRTLVRNDMLFCTDDCVLAEDALDVAMTTLYRNFPDGDGVVGLAQENIPKGYKLAFPLMGRTFLDRFRNLPASFTDGLGLGRQGDIFWPGYFHCFNDAEIGLTIMAMGNWVFEPNARLRHFHPDFSDDKPDATHHHALTFKDEDALRWCRRRASGLLWGIDEEPAISCGAS